MEIIKVFMRIKTIMVIIKTIIKMNITMIKIITIIKIIIIIIRIIRKVFLRRNQEAEAEEEAEDIMEIIIKKTDHKLHKMEIKLI